MNEFFVWIGIGIICLYVGFHVGKYSVLGNRDIYLMDKERE